MVDFPRRPRPSPLHDYDLENLAMVGANIGQGDKQTGTLSGYISIDGPCARRYALGCNHVGLS